MPTSYDYVIVGGGLQGSLLVLALAARQPQATVSLVDQAPRLGGNHTWCFHARDVSTEASLWIEPLVVHRWPGYRVRFPDLEDSLESAYAAITSERLHAVLQQHFASRPGSQLHLGVKVNRMSARTVWLEDGTSIHGRLIVDARGPVVRDGKRSEGYQKFLGLEVELARPHGLDRPILMDATVAQGDGYRFVYTLPLTEQKLLVEDTYFSNTPDLDRPKLRQRVTEYVTRWGHEIVGIEREEEGVLPMPWGGSGPQDATGPLRAGYRGGYFHPGTGYSLPVAVRLAEVLSKLPVENALGPALRAFTGSIRRQAAFCHVLNYMLFCWFPPAQRWHIFQRFYRLPLKTIERFYALRLRPIDMARLVVGRPPRGMSLRYGLERESQR